MAQKRQEKRQRAKDVQSLNLRDFVPSYGNFFSWHKKGINTHCRSLKFSELDKYFDFLGAF